MFILRGVPGHHAPATLGFGDDVSSFAGEDDWNRRGRLREALKDGLVGMLDSATRQKEEKMKMLPQVLFWLGLISVPFAWLVWYFGSEIEIIRPVLASINDPALRAALQEAHAERLGIWVAVWPVSLLVLSQILEKKMQG